MILSLISALYFSWMGLITALIVVITLLYLRRKFIQRIDGITGDTVGASIEIVEAVSILSFSLLLFY